VKVSSIPVCAKGKEFIAGCGWVGFDFAVDVAKGSMMFGLLGNRVNLA